MGLIFTFFTFQLPFFNMLELFFPFLLQNVLLVPTLRKSCFGNSVAFAMSRAYLADRAGRSGNVFLTKSSRKVILVNTK